jgi:hypothetical protein
VGTLRLWSWMGVQKKGEPPRGAAGAEVRVTSSW